MTTLTAQKPAPCPAVAAEILFAVRSGHEHEAELLAAAHWMTDLINTELEQLVQSALRDGPGTITMLQVT